MPTGATPCARISADFLPRPNLTTSGQAGGGEVLTTRRAAPAGTQRGPIDIFLVVGACPCYAGHSTIEGQPWERTTCSPERVVFCFGPVPPLGRILLCPRKGGGSLRRLVACFLIRARSLHVHPSCPIPISLTNSQTALWRSPSVYATVNTSPVSISVAVTRSASTVTS